MSAYDHIRSHPNILTMVFERQVAIIDALENELPTLDNLIIEECGDDPFENCDENE